MKSLTFLFFMKLYQKTSSEEDEVVGHNCLGVSTDRDDLGAEISLRRGLCQHLIYQDIIISNHHYHHYSKHCSEGDREISVVLWGRALWTSAQRQQVGVLPTYLPKDMDDDDVGNLSNWISGFHGEVTVGWVMMWVFTHLITFKES